MGMLGDALYDFANEAFDEIVFDGPDGERLLQVYNGWENSDATDYLFSIVNEAEEVGTEAARDAVIQHIKESKQGFIDFLNGEE